MLKVLLFYMFAWWFKKLENKRALIMRIVLAGIFGIFCWITSFALISMIEVDPTTIVIVIICFAVAILFTVRSICDITQIRKLFIDSENKKTTSQNENTKPHDFIHG